MAGSSGRLQVTVGDVRDARLVEKAVVHANEIYHFAAQVAVTTSVADPRLDFEVNLGGTFNVLDVRPAAPGKGLLSSLPPRIKFLANSDSALRSSVKSVMR